MTDETEKIIQSDAKLFLTRSENFEYLENMKFYRMKEWEYEKRIVSSLLIGSGSGVSLILAFLNAQERSDVVTAFAIFSIILFVLCLVSTGLAQICLNEAASKYVSLYTAMNNIQNYEIAEQNIDSKVMINMLVCAFIPKMSVDEENAEDLKFEFSDKKVKLRQQALVVERNAVKFQNKAAFWLKLSVALFLLGIFVGISFVLTGIL